MAEEWSDLAVSVIDNSSPDLAPEQRQRKAAPPVDARKAIAELDEAADAEVPAIAKEFLAALEEVRGSVPFAEIVSLLGSASPADLVRKLNFEGLYAMAPRLAARLISVFRRAGRVSARWLARAIGKLVDWRGDEAGRLWSEARAEKAVEQIIVASERAAEYLLGSLAVGALAGKFTPEGIVAVLQSGFGLNRAQIRRLETRAAKLLEQGASPQRVVRELEKQARKWALERGALIGENEAVDASREAQLEMARDAQASGVIRSVSKQWVTVERGILSPASEDEAAELGDIDTICCTCLPMDGVTVGLDEPFEVAVGHPDAEAGRDASGHTVCAYGGETIRVNRPGSAVHPLCRCGMWILDVEVA